MLSIQIKVVENYLCLIHTIMWFDFSDLSVTSGEDHKASLQSIDDMWQALSKMLESLDQQECDRLLNGILMFIERNSECKFIDSEV